MFVLLFSFLTTAANAAPRVIATIAPVHSLVAMVMKGAGVPDLLLPPKSSPHHFALKPSHARALVAADVVFLVGEDLERFLTRPLATLAEDARVVRLAEVAKLTRLAMRSGHNDHGHDDDEDGVLDPHMWLDPVNARLWLGVIAQSLTEVDPANSDRYQKNAVAAKKQLTTLEGDISKLLDPVRGRGYILFHDGFQYFENRFDFPAAATMALSDARPPGARRVAELRQLMTSDNISCVFSEPQLPAKIVETLIADTDIERGELDPIGMTLTPGPALYDSLIRNLASSLRDCLGE
jgi:zinc transport system substrate-binding protein